MCLLKCTSFNLSMSTILKVCFMCVYFHSLHFFPFFTSLVGIAVIYTLLISTPGFLSLWLASVQFSRSVVSNSLQSHGLQHAKIPCTSPTPRIGVWETDSCPLHRWCHPKYWSFTFSISPSNEYSGLISFRMGWLDLLAVQGTLKNLLQQNSSKASIL